MYSCIMAASLFTFITGALMCVAAYYYQVQQDAAQRSNLWKKQRKAYSSFLQEDPTLPGVVFSDDPKHETITSAGKEINMKADIGLSINIPEGSVVQSDEINMTITTSFSGPFQMPSDVESISPIFFVKLSSETAFHEDIEVKMQHNARIESEEDFKDLVLLKASTIPTYTEVDDASPEYRLEVVEGVRVEMVPGEPDFALVRLRGFSCFGLGREGRGDKVYSARLYKKFISPGARIEAVFCMCQQLQSYLKHCDDVIRKEYKMTARGKGLTVYKGLTITGNEIELDPGPLDSNTWKINMDRPVIPKVEIDEISSSSLFSVFTSFFTEEVPIPYGYPPRIFLKFIPVGKDNPKVTMTTKGLKPPCVFWIDKEEEEWPDGGCECREENQVMVNGICEEKLRRSEKVEPKVIKLPPCHEITHLNHLFDYLADSVSEWEVLCSRLGVEYGTIQALHYPSEASYKLYSCLRALLDLGPPHSCWEKVVSTVCRTPFYKKRLGKIIANDNRIEIPIECL